MGATLVINATGVETRVALVENGTISEFYLERKKDKGIVGNIYKGRVVRVLPGMQAAFVDVGLEKAAFLYVSDVFYDPDFSEQQFDLTEGEQEDIEDTYPEESEAEEAEAEAASQDGSTEPKPEGKPAEKPAEPTGEVKPVSEVPKVEAKVEPLAEPAPVPVTEPKTEARPEPKTEARPEPKTEARPEPKTEPVLEPKIEPKIDLAPIAPQPEEPVKAELPVPEEKIEAKSTAGATGDQPVHDSACVPEAAKADAPVAGDVASPTPAPTQAQANGEKHEGSDRPAEGERGELRTRDRGGRRRRRGGMSRREGRDRDEDREARDGRDQRGDRGDRDRGDRTDRGGDRSEREERGNGREQKPQKKMANIQDLLKVGQEIIVQVAKDPIGTKGARVTSHISLPGRHLVFMPTVDHVGISRRIERESERRRLREIVDRLRPSGTGFIVRTVAENIANEKLEADAKFLISIWNTVGSKKDKLGAPAILHPDLDLALRATRDLFAQDVDQLVIDDRVEWDRIRSFLDIQDPALKERVTLHDGDEPIFDAYGIEHELQKAQQRKVWLKSGGYLIMDQAEALTAIDVNSGRYVGKKSLEETITKINIEAAREIVYQLRLRNIGGIIIIDFIDMDKSQNRDKVFKALQDALGRDKAKTNVLKISELGLVEMTRKRVRESLGRTLNEPCSYCDGRGQLKSKRTVAYEIFREIRREATNYKEATLVVNCHPDVGRVLQADERDELRYLMDRFNKSIHVRAQPSYHQEQFDIYGKADRPDRPQQRGKEREEGDKSEHGDRPERPEKQDRAERGERQERQQRAERPERGGDRGDRPDKGERQDRGERGDRDRNERGDRGDRPDRSERADRQDRQDRSRPPTTAAPAQPAAPPPPAEKPQPPAAAKPDEVKA
jgi:ribonuclease G